MVNVRKYFMCIFSQSKVVIFCDNASVCTECAFVYWAERETKWQSVLTVFDLCQMQAISKPELDFHLHTDTQHTLPSWLAEKWQLFYLLSWLPGFFGKLLKMITIKHDILRAVDCCCCSFFSLSLFLTLSSSSAVRVASGFWYSVRYQIIYHVHHSCVAGTCVSVCAPFYGKMCQ